MAKPLTQRTQSSPSQRPLIEWPTLAMVVICYAGLVGVLAWGDGIGVAGSVVLLAVFIALHSSLQHEVLHGHPFRSKVLSEALVFPAVGLFVPYQRFRDLHLQHHYDPNLTDPYDDPESNYADPAAWALTSAPIKALYRFNNLLLGRMLVGPAISLWQLYKDDFAAFTKGDLSILWAYGLHVAGMIPVLYVVQGAAIPLWAYVMASYFGFSLLKIRTYLEHRAHEKVPGRSVIIESRGPLSLLFLNNNFHSVHHAHPKLAWYKLPACFAQRRSHFLDRNQSYYYASYVDVFRRYFLRAKDPVPHPLMAGAKQERELEHQ
ncbi:MAG: fatty acid desaturase [Roseovarius sp.]|nr:fatty acid desaturase [Roseovarius sp.]